jgi:hypothetical protein
MFMKLSSTLFSRKLQTLQSINHNSNISRITSFKTVIDDSAEAFNTHTILHEVCHSNGPHHVLGHADIAVKTRLQELHSGLEEGKADITALYAAPLLVDNGVITDVSKKEFWVTFLAGIFRTGTAESQMLVDFSAFWS